MYLWAVQGCERFYLTTEYEGKLAGESYQTQQNYQKNRNKWQENQRKQETPYFTLQILYSKTIHKSVTHIMWNNNFEWSFFACCFFRPDPMAPFAAGGADLDPFGWEIPLFNFQNDHL